MVSVGRASQAQNGLQQALHVGGSKQILTAGDKIDALVRIVQHHGEVIAGADVPAGQNDVTEQCAVDSDHARFTVRAAATFLELEVRHARQAERTSGVEPPGRDIAGRLAQVTLDRRQVPAGARIQRTIRPLRSRCHAGKFPGNGATRAETGIDEAGLSQPLKSGLIRSAARGLMEHRTIRLQPEPGEFREDRCCVCRGTPGCIQIFHPDQKPATRLMGSLMGDEGGVGMTQMQFAGGAGCEAGGQGCGGARNHDS